MKMLPRAPETIKGYKQRLIFRRIVEGDFRKGLVPYYHFHIVDELTGSLVGHINFRVGDTPHVQECAGHIGFEIKEGFRGEHRANHACLALSAFIGSIYDSVIITADPDNTASIKIIERLGAVFIDRIQVPTDDPHYARGSRYKLRYRWAPQRDETGAKDSDTR